MVAKSLWKEDIWVHLIFSDGNGLGGDDERYQIYSIALFPFALSIPPENVYFTIDPRLVEAPGLIKLVCRQRQPVLVQVTAPTVFPKAILNILKRFAKRHRALKP